MSIRKEDGKLKTNQGDSFKLGFNIKRLNTITLYQVFLQINFPKPLIKSQEITTDQEGNSKVIFNISKEETEVPIGKYTFGVKACYKDEEDTIYTGTLEILTKYVEGN